MKYILTSIAVLATASVALAQGPQHRGPQLQPGKPHLMQPGKPQVKPGKPTSLQPGKPQVKPGKPTSLQLGKPQAQPGKPAPQHFGKPQVKPSRPVLHPVRVGMPGKSAPQSGMPAPKMHYHPRGQR
ncbi:MAG: hypothetical protein IKW48_09480 [Akkermansia sp.]|nr:hypothetical protein [Akkermansia sp.]